MRIAQAYEVGWSTRSVAHHDGQNFVLTTLRVYIEAECCYAYYWGMQNHYDIIIIGGGLTGTSLACALPNFKIAILEQHLPNFLADTTNDTRPLTLTYGSQQILQQLHLWNTLAPKACPIKKVHVSEKGRFGSTTFSAQAQNVPALGYVVPFNLLQQILYQKVSSQPNIDFIASNKINAIENNKVSFTHADNTQTLSAELIVAADGSYSTTRGLLNIEIDKQDHQEIAQTAFVELSRPHQHIAYERFSKMGTLAMMPLFKDKQMRLVWTMSQAMHAKTKTWNAENWLALVNDHFATRIGKINTVKPNQVFPLQTMIAKNLITEHAVIIGNAAHTIYPIAAQGFNLGLQDAITLAEILKFARTEQLNLNAPQILEQYATAMHPIQKNIIQLTQRITETFELQLPFTGQVRGLSLLTLDLLKPLKSRFAKRMMGA